MSFIAALPRALRGRMTYANLMSSVAVFLALGGGAYALSVPKDSVGRPELKRDAVTAAKVKDRSLTARDFRRHQLPALGGVRAADLSPAPAPGAVVKSVGLRMKAAGRTWVLGTVRDVFLTCGDVACSAQWGIYVDNKPVAYTGMKLQAQPGASDGYTFYTLYGLTKRLTRGRHTVVMARTNDGAPVSVGQLGAQLGALTVGK